jgi:sRNA-binding protein
MHEGINLLAKLYPRWLCLMNRRPRKIGVCEEVIRQHPEMSRHRIKLLLKTYTQSPEYWSTLTAGTPRIDLAGDVAGEVHGGGQRGRQAEDPQGSQASRGRGDRAPQLGRPVPGVTLHLTRV